MIQAKAQELQRAATAAPEWLRLRIANYRSRSVTDLTLLADLVAVSQRVVATAARLGKVRELAALLRALAPEDVDVAVHYLSGQTPQGRSGIGAALLRAAAGHGGAGEATLSIAEVNRELAAIAADHGAGSAARREQALRALLARATAAEQKFLVDLLLGELRQGALAGVMADAIAAAADLPAAQVRRAAMYAGSLGEVARAALGQGASALETFQLQLFAPVAPMLAQTAADVAEALQALHGDVAFEWKMDGARIQVHKRADDVRIYTRTLNQVGAALPEIVDQVRSLGGRELVLDGEAIALSASGRPHPFQVTMRRFGRKLDVEQVRRELPMSAFFFDCLYVDGRSVADLPTRERFAVLSDAVPAALRMPRIVTSAPGVAHAFYQAALAAGHEGVMAKSLDAPYEAGNRDARWLKIKHAHTLDLVVLAAEWGHGRRVGKLSNLHLGALEPSSGNFVMLGKTFKGLTDAMLEWQTGALLARETHRDQWTVHVRPELVVEIAFSDLQASTRYPGGLALRLARVKRYRDDKTVEEADTMDSVRRLYAAQAGALG
jgi:DNA ligase-1